MSVCAAEDVEMEDIGADKLLEELATLEPDAKRARLHQADRAQGQEHAHARGAQAGHTTLQNVRSDSFSPPHLRLQHVAHGVSAVTLDLRNVSETVAYLKLTSEV